MKKIQFNQTRKKKQWWLFLLFLFNSSVERCEVLQNRQRALCFLWIIHQWRLNADRKWLKLLCYCLIFVVFSNHWPTWSLLIIRAVWGDHLSVHRWACEAEHGLFLSFTVWTTLQLCPRDARQHSTPEAWKSSSQSNRASSSHRISSTTCKHRRCISSTRYLN